jgi:hypothetical protein
MQDALQPAPVCPQCGYSLRGIDGDPVRCPECGSLTLRADLQMPFAEIGRALRTLITPASTAFIAGAWWIAVLTLGAVGGFLASREKATIVIVLAAPGLIAWWLLTRWFGKRCGRAPGWRRTLANIHLRYLLFLVVLGISTALALLAANRLRPFLPRFSRKLESGLTLLLVAFVWLCMTRGRLGTFMAGFLHGPLVPYARRLALEWMRDNSYPVADRRSTPP